MSKGKTAIKWYKNYESWIWRSALLTAGAIASLWLHSQFVSLKIYWDIRTKDVERFERIEGNLAALNERTHLKLKEEEK